VHRERPIVGSFFKDEKLKFKLPTACWYCGSTKKLSVDHVVARSKGGPDGGENLIQSCSTCNSSSSVNSSSTLVIALCCC
jgi:5-methylcytosine-specific restriction endonuclease McrA